MADLTVASATEPGPEATDLQRAQFHHQRALNLCVRMYLPNSAPTREQYEALVADFEAAHRLCPDSWSAALNLMWCYEDMREPAKARAMADKLEKGKRHAFVDSFLAHRLNERGEYQRALDISLKTPWPPDSPLRNEHTLERVRAWAATGDVDSLLQHLGKRIMGCDEDEGKLHLLFHIEEYVGKVPKSTFAKIDAAAFEARIKKMIADTPDESGFPIALGVFYANAGRFNEELQTLVAACDRHAASSEFRHHFARVVWRTVASKEKPTIP